MSHAFQQSPVEQLSDMDQFLHQTFWKGRMIGQPALEPLGDERVSLRADHFALTTLATYIAQHAQAEAHPLDIYKADETFSCDRYPCGTIIDYSEVSLTTTNHLTIPKVKARSDKITAKPGAYTPPVLPPVGRIDIKDDDAHFRKADHYAVIVRGKEGYNIPLSIITSGAIIAPNGKVHFQHPILIHHPPTMKVGRTQHHRLPQSGREQLQQQTAVRVLLEGEPKRKFVPLLRRRPAVSRTLPAAT